jgi:hypothetical protein
MINRPTRVSVVESQNRYMAPRTPPVPRRNLYKSTVYTLIGCPAFQRTGLFSSLSRPRGHMCAHMPQPTQAARFTSWLLAARSA